MRSLIKQVSFFGTAITLLIGCQKQGKENLNNDVGGSKAEVSQSGENAERGELIVRGSQSLFTLQLTNSEEPGQSINMTYRKIIFEDQSVLYTNGANVELTADEIQFTNATIDTFEPGLRKAQIGQNGATGGAIHFSAKKVGGKLRVLLRGQDGGDPYPARIHFYRAQEGKPTNAASLGRRGQYDCVINGPTFEFYGQKGMTGEKGFTGSDGTEGGSTGTFQFDLPSREGFKLDVSFITGFAGTPGEGGPGQQGGPGGIILGGIKTGDHYIYPCIPRPLIVYEGAAGEKGPTGDPGKPGVDGQIETACIVPQASPKICYPIGRK